MLQSRDADSSEVEKAGLVHRVYQPQGSQEPYPTVVLVHGRAGNGKVMWLFSKALEEVRPLVVSPQAPDPDPLGGYSWWKLFHPEGQESPAPRRTTAEDLQAPLASLTAFIESLPALYGCDLSRLYGFGFSQGAALLASLSIQRPELFRGVGMLSGFLPGVMHQQLQAQPRSTSLPSYFIAHGSKDEIIPCERSLQARDDLQAAGARVRFHSDAVGHKVGSSGIKALRSWVEELFDEH